MNQKADIPLLSIICIYLAFLCLEPLIKIPNKFIPTHLLSCILTTVLFVAYSNPFVWSSKEIKTRKENKSVTPKLVMSLILSTMILAIRMFIPLFFILEDKLTLELTTAEIIFITFKTFLYAMLEEMIFSYGLGKLFKEIKLPKYISWPIICIIFASAHFIGKEFFALDFIVIAVIRLLFLTIFNLFPSIILISFVHFGTNIVNVLMIDML